MFSPDLLLCRAAFSGSSDYASAAIRQILASPRDQPVPDGSAGASRQRRQILWPLSLPAKEGTLGGHPPDLVRMKLVNPFPVKAAEIIVNPDNSARAVQQQRRKGILRE